MKHCGKSHAIQRIVQSNYEELRDRTHALHNGEDRKTPKCVCEHFETQREEVKVLKRFVIYQTYSTFHANKPLTRVKSELE